MWSGKDRFVLALFSRFAAHFRESSYLVPFVHLRLDRRQRFIQINFFKLPECVGFDIQPTNEELPMKAKIKVVHAEWHKAEKQKKKNEPKIATKKETEYEKWQSPSNRTS